MVHYFFIFFICLLCTLFFVISIANFSLMKLFGVHAYADAHTHAYISFLKFLWRNISLSSEWNGCNSKNECESYEMRCEVWISLIFYCVYFSFFFFFFCCFYLDTCECFYLLIDVAVGTSYFLVQFTRSPPVGYGVRCTASFFNCHTALWLLARIYHTPITNWNTNFEKLSVSTSTLTILHKKGSIYLQNGKRWKNNSKNGVTIQASVPITVKHWFQHSIF